MTGSAHIVRGNALALPLPDASVDLVVTSPPYFGLRSYTDGCPDCADRARAGNRGYMERYCPQCSRVFTSGRNQCHICKVTTLTTEATKVAQKATDCTTCGGSGQGHYAGQIGSEATPTEFVAALLAATREMVRVLKPSGSIFVNLGDKYVADNRGSGGDQKRGLAKYAPAGPAGYPTGGMRQKSLMGIPWRYALACIDTTQGVPVHIVREMVAAVYNGNLDPQACDEILKEYEAGGRNAGLGLILRAEIIWAKPNGLPESVTDRVRRSHEQWFHMVRSPRYFSAVDEIREPHLYPSDERYKRNSGYDPGMTASINSPLNPLGKLPGSVWTVPTQPLTVPPQLGVDHFAAFPMEWPRRIITGWSPSGICTVCGEGRRPVKDQGLRVGQQNRSNPGTRVLAGPGRIISQGGYLDPANASCDHTEYRITGYACACGQLEGRTWIPTTTATSQSGSATSTGTPATCARGASATAPTDATTPAAARVIAPPTRPAVVLDPFGGTGTTALVASVMGRIGISVDMSADYCRLAQWRVNDPGQRAAAAQVEKPEPVHPDQLDLFAEEGA